MHMPAFLSKVLSRGNMSGGTAYQLYGAVVAQARDPVFYGEYDVPDNVDGRFDMIVLHLFLLSGRLDGDDAERRLAQAVINIFFADMDRSLREMGAGDMAVPKKIKKMASAFNGRMAAYGEAFAQGGKAMADAVARNIFPDATKTPAGAKRLAAYAVAAGDLLAVQPAGDLAAGRVTFPAPGRTRAPA